MNSHVVVAVSLKGTSFTEAITFDSSMDHPNLLLKALRTFHISEELLHEYSLYIPAIGCYVKSFEHMLRDHLIYLEKNMSRLDWKSNKTSQKPISQNPSTSSSLHSHVKELLVEIDDEKVLLDDISYYSENANEEEKQEFDQIDENLDEVKIPIDDLVVKSFQDRTELTLYMRAWGVSNDFLLILDSRERMLKKDLTKITRLICNNKYCQFFLEFRCNTLNENKYKLEKHCSIHNHKLQIKNGSLDFTPDIIKKLIELRSVSDDTKAITDQINKTFNKTFDYTTIWYHLRKQMDIEYGKPSSDADTLINLLEEDQKERGVFFCKEVDSEGKLVHFCFMTNRMKLLANRFNDVIIIDASHKTNRFGMPLLDIVTIDNLGRTCTIFIALLKSQKYEEWKWALECFKSNLTSLPQIIFTDEEEALRKSLSFLNRTFF